MKFLKNFDWSVRSIAKVVGVVILGIFAFSVVIALISFSFRTIFHNSGSYMGSYDNDYPMTDMAYSEKSVSRLSMPSIPKPGFSGGNDAESYEVKTYSAQINTRKLKKTCKVISDLKSREDVIFEDSNENDMSCSYRFKVKKDSASDVFAVIKSLKPKDLNQNIQTIKGAIEGFDKQLDILQKKLISVEETLASAQKAYDDVQDLATRKQDVESLSTIISNKLELINKLTNERLNVKSRIDSYARSRAEQMERLNYSFFNVNIFKDTIFDWNEIKDSWKYEFKAFIRNFNDVLQGVSVNLVTYMIRFIQVTIYFFLSLFLLKLVWGATKKIWKGGKR